MTTSNEFKTNDTVTFDIYPNGLIPGNFKNVTFKDRLSYDSVQLFGYDAAASWVNAYPTLPGSVVNDPTKYNWLTFKQADGTSRIVCEAWINQSTVSTNVSNPVIVTINDPTTNTINELTQACIALGYLDFKVAYQS